MTLHHEVAELFEEAQLVGNIAMRRRMIREHFDAEGFGPNQTVDLWLHQLGEDTARLAELGEH